MNTTPSQKHTPGPWTYFVGNADGRGLIRIEVDRSADGAGTHIASMQRGTQSEANAAFIVRACNAHDGLVAALETAKEYIRQDMYESGLRRDYADTNTLNVIDAALRAAKAQERG